MKTFFKNKLAVALVFLSLFAAGVSTVSAYIYNPTGGGGSGGVTIGQTVTGGTINQFLVTDASGNIANTALLHDATLTGNGITTNLSVVAGVTPTLSQVLTSGNTNGGLTISGSNFLTANATGITALKNSVATGILKTDANNNVFLQGTSTAGSVTTGTIGFNSSGNPLISFLGGSGTGLVATDNTGALSFLSSGGFVPYSGATGTVNLNAHFLSNILDPVLAQDAASKAYVDSISTGLSWKTVVAVATTTTLPANTYNNGASGVGRTLTAVLPAVLTIDGYAPILGDRILVKNEAAPANNGIYTMTTVGTVGVAYILTGATDADQAAEQTLAATAVINGTANANTAWVQATPQPITMGTTGLVWNNFLNSIYTAGAGLTLTGHVFSLDVANANTWTGQQIFNTAQTQFGVAPRFSALTTNGGIFYGNGTGVLQQTGAGPTTTVLHGGTSPSYSAVGLTTDVTGLLPVTNGGTGLGTLTANNLIIGNGTSTPNFLAPSTSGKVPISNGTTFVMSTPTFPNASATLNKVIKSDGTNWVASTETYAVPGTSGNVMTSNGTNWTSAAPAAPVSYTGLIESLGLEDANTTIGAGTYTIELFASYGYTINILHIKSASGTATAALQINGTNVTSCSAVAVSSTISNTNCTAANTVVSGDKVTLVISAPTTLNDLTVSIKTTRT